MILRGSNGDNVSSMISSPSLCPSGENAGVGKPGGEEDGAGDESLRRREGRDLDRAFDRGREVDGAGDGWAVEATGDCKSVAISCCACTGWKSQTIPQAYPISTAVYCSSIIRRERVDSVSCAFQGGELSGVSRGYPTSNFVEQTVSHGVQRGMRDARRRAI